MKKKILLLVIILSMMTPVVTVTNAAEVVPVKTGAASSEPSPEAIRAAVEEFRALSRKERKAKIKEAKKELKVYKKERKAGQEPSTNTLLLVILCILLPPLAVYLHQGEINNKFWISLLLTLLFWIPGVIYSLIVVLGAD